MRKKLLIATGNTGKLREFAELLAELPVELLMPKDLGISLDVAETGSTYQENAVLKALAFAEASGLTSLADDSGLEVDALGGAPGLYSARYSPKPGATDADRRAYMLENLEGKPQPWHARFQCVIAVAFPDGEMLYGKGTCEGEIIPGERGSGGFGYDPIFQLPAGLTMAELPAQQKNRLSHRALAVLDVQQALLEKLNR
jgi:XTP/dITP diphosphohydrolase